MASNDKEQHRHILEAENSRVPWGRKFTSLLGTRREMMGDVSRCHDACCLLCRWSVKLTLSDSFISQSQLSMSSMTGKPNARKIRWIVHKGGDVRCGSRTNTRRMLWA
jgi:hypothetical protein